MGSARSCSYCCGLAVTTRYSYLRSSLHFRFYFHIDTPIATFTQSRIILALVGRISHCFSRELMGRGRTESNQLIARLELTQTLKYGSFENQRVTGKSCSSCKKLCNWIQIVATSLGFICMVVSGLIPEHSVNKPQPETNMEAAMKKNKTSSILSKKWRGRSFGQCKAQSSFLH